MLGQFLGAAATQVDAENLSETDELAHQVHLVVGVVERGHIGQVTEGPDRAEVVQDGRQRRYPLGRHDRPVHPPAEHVERAELALEVEARRRESLAGRPRNLVQGAHPVLIHQHRHRGIARIAATPM